MIFLNKTFNQEYSIVITNNEINIKRRIRIFFYIFLFIYSFVDGLMNSRPNLCKVVYATLLDNTTNSIQTYEYIESF